MKEDYPIFEKWFKILDWLLDRTNSYPKNVRFSISQRIQNMALDIYEKIIEAIYTKKRLALLYGINMLLEKLRAYMRISYHRQYINLKQFEFIAVELNEAGKMIGGWIKQEQKTNETNR
jgi:flagellar biosynthesis/type III secretory pathway protein FliH